MERSKIRVGIDAAECPLVWDVINNSGHAVGGRTDKHHREHKEQKGLVGDGLPPFCVGPFSLKTRLVLGGHGAVCELGLHDHGLFPSGNEQTKARCSCRPMAKVGDPEPFLVCRGSRNERAARHSRMCAKRHQESARTTRKNVKM